jgi:hypothetical protein
MEDKIDWELSIGLYPGILLGFRTYDEEDFTIHVLYLPLIYIAFTMFDNK